MGRPAMSDPGTSYHGQPILKEPVWTWEIPTYFFFGGMAGSSVGLAYAMHLRGDAVAARRAWLTALAGLSISPALLISDLGRPARFLKMLRMFKVTSPMSVGTWAVSATAAATGLATLDALGVSPPGLISRVAVDRAAVVARPVAALGGLSVATYTAALLVNTSIPAWHEARWTLPMVFASGAALSAGGACTALTPIAHAGAARRLALIGAVAELASTELMHRRLGIHAETYRSGSAARSGRLSRASIVAGAALLARGGARHRAAAAGAGALLCAGAMATRWSVFAAGRQSAADPRYVVEPQRARLATRPG
jgi:formate-dependent nitrite reductase membrane component NrfD